MNVGVERERGNLGPAGAVALALLLTGSTLLSAVGTAILPCARAK